MWHNNAETGINIKVINNNMEIIERLFNCFFMADDNIIQNKKRLDRLTSQ